MAFLTNSQIFIQKLETTPGSGVLNIHTVTTSERVRELDFSIEVSKDDEASKYLTGDYAQNDESIIGMKTGTAGYSIKVAPGQYTPATSGHLLTYKDYLANAGLDITEVNVSGITAGTYHFYPSATKSAATASVARITRDSDSTISMVECLTGAMSNFTLSVDGVGKPFSMKFESKGAVGGLNGSTVISGVYDIATSSVAGFDEAGVMRTVADNFLNTTVKITDLLTNSEYSFCINKATFESGNELNAIECQNSSSGIRNYIITGINPTVEIDPLLQTLAQFNYWAGFTTEKFYRVEIISEFVSLVIPRAQILNAAVADANGFLRNTLKMRALRNIDSYAPVGLTGTPEMMYVLSIKESLKDY